MLNDEDLIERAKRQIEQRTGWGDSQDWTNQDYIALSEKIQEQTGVSLSHVTLKRIWGKVKYESLPNTHTLNTLVQYLGYENWRAFRTKDGNGQSHPAEHVIVPKTPKTRDTRKIYTWIWVLVAVAVLAGLAIFLMPAKKATLDTDLYSFSSKKIVANGVPNTVVFDYDATAAPNDSVFIQQSWNKALRVSVPKDQHQHTSIYYFPEFVRAKLIIGNEVVREHNLFITSDGWIPIVENSPVPVYFDIKDALADGKMALSVEKLKASNIELQPDPPKILYTNVKDFGEIYTDNFSFETLIRNDYKEGSAACQKTVVYLLCECEATAVGIPLCAKGCVSDIDLLYVNFYASGKQKDLSAFGVDFKDFIKLRIESKPEGAKIYINDQLKYEIQQPITKSKIVGIDYLFDGTGSVDWVKLSNGTVEFEDEFEN